MTTSTTASTEAAVVAARIDEELLDNVGVELPAAEFLDLLDYYH